MIDLDQDHKYSIMGFPVKGVNELLKDYGVIPPISPYIKNLEYHQDLGHKIHTMCQLYFEGTLDETTLHPLLQERLVGLKKLCAEHELETYETEERVGSLPLGVAGTLDWRGMFDGVHTIVDWKKGKQVFKGGTIPIIAYKYLKNRELESKELVETVMIIHILPNNYKIMKLTKFSGDEQELFMCCIQLECFKNGK